VSRFGTSRRPKCEMAKRSRIKQIGRFLSVLSRPPSASSRLGESCAIDIEILTPLIPLRSARSARRASEQAAPLRGNFADKFPRKHYMSGAAPDRPADAGRRAEYRPSNVLRAA